MRSGGFQNINKAGKIVNTNNIKKIIKEGNMPAVHFTDNDFEAKVLKGKGLFFVDFYADWCGPCKQAAPIIDELFEEYKGKITIGKLNTDENQTTSGKYGIMSIPTVVVFKDGKELDRMSGFAGKEGYVKLINKVLGEK